MEWTDKQKDAIESRNSNILVAAAAGSGKTAVLVERIKRLIIEEGVPLDRMLMVTFTDAAAAEMKEKIRKAIYKEMEQNPEKSRKLKEQLNLLGRANISTFHSFALDVIRTFFFRKNIEPNFSICDDSQRTILKEDAMDLLMESCFERKDEDFYLLLDWYGTGRNQKRLREIIESTYNSLQAMPYPMDWLEGRLEELEINPDNFLGSAFMKNINEYVMFRYEKIIELVEDRRDALADNGLERLAEKVNTEELAVLRNGMAAYNDEQNPFALRDTIDGFSFARLSPKKEEKEAYEACKQMVSAISQKAKTFMDDLKKTVFAQSPEEHISDMNSTARAARALKKMLVEFDRIFKSAKTEKNLVDFNDIEHLALSILEDEAVCCYYREKFRYIFIDEYQDTNILQEEIISKVKREDNMFMVGDVKQSIYKFRLAEPEIFMRKYAEYGDDSKSKKIDLNQNFRSKPVLISGINEIFEDIMPGYDNNARLYPGIPYEGEYSYPLKTVIIDRTDMEEADEELQELNSVEMEALKVCDIINEHIGKPFFDTKNNVVRPLEQRDIVILMRAVKNYAGIFYNVLKENGIDSYIDDSDGYFDTMEINVFLNLLSVIDNKMQDVPLISVLHSEIFDFSSEELARIRAEHKNGSFYSAFKAYGEGGSHADLREKCAKAMSELKNWKEMSTTMPLGRFLWKLLIDTGYYMKMGAMPGGVQRQANLRTLIDKAENYSYDRQVSLYSFVRYIDTIKEKGVSVGQVKLLGEQDDLVRIMTIHKSKGLEFPMVIVCGMGRMLRYSGNGTGVSLHKDIGLGLTLVNRKAGWYKKTLMQQLIADRVHREEVDEQKRVLYVAMTRAKDVLYLVGTCRKPGDKLEDSEGLLRNDSTYLDMIGYLRNRTLIDAKNLELPEEADERQGGSLYNVFKKAPSEGVSEEIQRRLEFEYPFKDEVNMKQKYSVSEINSSASKHEYFETPLKTPEFLSQDKSVSAAEKGTIHHAIMEYLDFEKAFTSGIEYIREACRQMVEACIITEEELDTVRPDNVAHFFETDLGRRCAVAAAKGTLEKEKPFVIKMEHEGKQVLVQGVIDCMFEEDGEYVLVDYKTNRIDPGKPFEEEAKRLKDAYRRQLEIYCQAIEKGKDKKVKEAYLYLVDGGRAVEM